MLFSGKNSFQKIAPLSVADLGSIFSWVSLVNLPQFSPTEMLETSVSSCKCSLFGLVLLVSDRGE